MKPRIYYHPGIFVYADYGCIWYKGQKPKIMSIGLPLRLSPTTAIMGVKE